MLKLMRLENTSVFAIVADDQFESEMEILGCVRMNYKDGKHYIRTFDTHGEDWFAELNEAIKEKEENLYGEVKCVRRSLNLENIIIQYLREKGEETVRVDVIKKLVLHLFDKIHKKGYLFIFSDYNQLNDEQIKTHLKGCKRVSLQEGNICIKDSFSDIKCFNPNTAVDFRIMEMIREFIAKAKR